MTELAPRPADQRGQRLSYLIKRLEMAERARLEEVLRPLGVTLHQYTVLSILERREGLSSAQLARRHYVTPQAMQQLVASMERDQLIERRADPTNRRVLRAGLTERGGEVLRSCHEVVDGLETRMLSALTSDEAVMFGRMLERCLVAVTEPAPTEDA
jgi:DNA-binding MarR family transcriptional regulator